MGSFRLLLAVGVMLGHLAFYPNSLPYMLPGDVAVEAFYIVSGFLITLVLTEKYADRTMLFYSNRLLRIYPIYWVCLALYVLANVAVLYGLIKTAHYSDEVNSESMSALWWSIHHPSSLYDKVWLTLVNFFIVGQDWLRSFGGNSIDVYYYHHFVYVRVAWTVAIELTFYLIAPFVVRNVYVTSAVLVASFALQSWAAADPTSIHLGYQLFPCALWCFMAGSLAYRLYAKLRANKSAATIGFSIAAVIIVFGVTAAYNSIGMPRLLYLPLVAALLPGVVLLGRMNPYDGILGDISYPLYLVHPLALIIILPGKHFELIAIGSIVAISILLVYLVERPIDRIRQRRARAAQSAMAARATALATRAL